VARLRSAKHRVEEAGIRWPQALVSPRTAFTADRHLDLGVPAWNFSDKVLRWLLHGKQSLRFDPKDLLIPFVGRNRWQ
jgi:hypothetical protein